MNDYYQAVRQQNADGSKGAVLSADGLYRYELFRVWDQALPVVVWIMLNPSTADHEADDPTIRKCVKFAKAWGYGGIRVVNLFALRATDPDLLKPAGYPKAVGEHNDQYLAEACRDAALIVAAWGQKGKLWGRAASVRFKLGTQGVKLHALKVAKDGFTPHHPLYLKDDSRPFPLGG